MALITSGCVPSRNIHPEAMLLDKDGWLRLGGTMFIRSPRTNARLWTVCGVPDYLAPEVIQGLGHSRMSDFWALGVLIHEMCTGRPPFDGDDPLDSMRLVLLNESKIILQVRDPTTWTTLQQDRPDHLGLWYNVLPEHQIALITSVCVPCRTRPATWWRSCSSPSRRRGLASRRASPTRPSCAASKRSRTTR